MFPHQFLLFPFHVFTTTEMFPLCLAILVFSSVDSPSFLPFYRIVLILPALKEVGTVNQVVSCTVSLPPPPVAESQGGTLGAFSYFSSLESILGTMVPIQQAGVYGILAALPQCPILSSIGELDTHCVLLPLTSPKWLDVLPSPMFTLDVIDNGQWAHILTQTCFSMKLHQELGRQSEFTILHLPTK